MGKNVHTPEVEKLLKGILTLDRVLMLRFF